MHADYVGKESRTEHQKHRDGHEQRRRAILYRPGLARQPMHGPAHGDKEEQRPADGDEENPKRGQTTRRVHKGDSEGEEDPAHDVVSDTSGENDYADGRVEELELCQYTCQNGKRGDRERDANEKEEVGVDRGWIDEFVVDRFGKTSAEPERQDHAGARNLVTTFNTRRKVTRRTRTVKDRRAFRLITDPSILLRINDRSGPVPAGARTRDPQEREREPSRCWQLNLGTAAIRGERHVA